MKKARYIFLIALIIVILFNFKITTEQITLQHEGLTNPDVFPGTPFLILKPLLEHVYRAGYYSDYKPINPDTDQDYAYDFQTAQFALAPTILDYENPGNYEFVILNLAHPGNLASVLERWPSHVVIASGDLNVVLIKRIK